MRIPHLVWNRRHNVASLSVSYGRRVWQTREVGDLILGYNAAGRLSRVVILDPRTLLGTAASEAEAISAVTAVLLRTGAIPQRDLEVLQSALERARNGPGRGPFPLAPGAGPRSTPGVARHRTAGP